MRSPPDGWSLADLGSFALKGLDRAEPLVQLSHPASTTTSGTAGPQAQLGEPSGGS